MKIGVVILIIQDTFIYPLLECIQRNTVLPDGIIIINNSNIELNVPENVTVFKPLVPLGVNASWNYVFQKYANSFDLISVLNDDLLIEEFFFEKLKIAAEGNPIAGVFCPDTVRDLSVFQSLFDQRQLCSPMSKREGWAFTIRSSVAKQIPPIPTKLQTWCGDDWIWRHCYKIGRPWLKMVNNKCFHFVGQSCKLADKRKDLTAEKSIFKTLL